MLKSQYMNTFGLYVSFTYPESLMPQRFQRLLKDAHVSALPGLAIRPSIPKMLISLPLGTFVSTLGNIELAFLYPTRTEPSDEVGMSCHGSAENLNKALDQSYTRTLKACTTVLWSICSPFWCACKSEGFNIPQFYSVKAFYIAIVATNNVTMSILGVILGEI